MSVGCGEGGMARIWRSDDNLRCWASFPSSLGQGFLLLTTVYIRLAGPHASEDSPVCHPSSPRSIGIVDPHSCVQLSVDPWDVDSGPHSWAASSPSFPYSPAATAVVVLSVGLALHLRLILNSQSSCLIWVLGLQACSTRLDPLFLTYILLASK